ncbi:universal stress protein [Nocardia seriolae]|uniref:Universal stress protein n=1 Tax=Nocardia seriolae TaxID=37332 RepID=A0ABC8AWR6_9NOCA|nr:universal stress protein [Nocardia seriolae]APA98419.1 Universal stress protein [Nocardia seriolae]MTJ64117.1 universal stress protein [Nocardia seriolae]MTJ73630.1 universal stress protein [Nocardia seriolae]MTJ88103.1 universal stress protein [Nocardia seriolae]MTK32093.1 universal stress protein [Nocardia seriolae]
MTSKNTGGRPLDPPIIVAVDGSAIAERAAAWAAADAALYDCPLRIITSVAVPLGFEAGPMLSDTDIRQLREAGERVVAAAARVARVAASGAALAISTEVTMEPIIPQLLELSRSARVVVVGSRGVGTLRRGLLGSVSTAVTHHAHCPVAVIHGAAAADPVSARLPVVVGVDGTPNSEPAIEIAFREASLRKVALTAVHAWSDLIGPPVPGWDSVRDQESEVLGERLAGFRERYPDVEVKRILVMDRPAHALLDESENAQLLVVGSHGRGGFTGMLLGSTSNALLHTADCPTLIVRKD